MKVEDFWFYVIVSLLACTIFQGWHCVLMFFIIMSIFDLNCTNNKK